MINISILKPHSKYFREKKKQNIFKCYFPKHVIFRKNKRRARALKKLKLRELIRPYQNVTLTHESVPHVVVYCLPVGCRVLPRDHHCTIVSVFRCLRNPVPLMTEHQCQLHE